MTPQLRSSLTTWLFGTVCLAAMTTKLAAGGDYPNRTIKIVVPVPPGPLLDVVPRITSERSSLPNGASVSSRTGLAQRKISVPRT